MSPFVLRGPGLCHSDVSRLTSTQAPSAFQMDFRNPRNAGLLKFPAQGIKHGIQASQVPSTLLLDDHTCHPTLVLPTSQRDAITSRRTSRYRLTGVTQASLSALSEPSGLVPGWTVGPGPSPAQARAGVADPLASFRRFSHFEAAQLFRTGVFFFSFFFCFFYPFPVSRMSSGYCFRRLRVRQQRVKVTASSPKHLQGPDVGDKDIIHRESQQTSVRCSDTLIEDLLDLNFLTYKLAPVLQMRYIKQKV